MSLPRALHPPAHSQAVADGAVEANDAPARPTPNTLPRPDDELRCLLRGPGGRTREAARQRVSAGAASGSESVVSLPLPLLDPREREFAVQLVRGDTVLARTDWRPLAPPR